MVYNRDCHIYEVLIVQVTAVSCQSKMAAEEGMTVEESSNSVENTDSSSVADIFMVEGEYLDIFL